MGKELEVKIIIYLEKILLSEKINSKKRNLLLVEKQEYHSLEQKEKEYQELVQEISREEQKFLLVEIKNLVAQKKQLITKIKEQLITEEGINQNIVMEIRPGTGGDEAGLFAHDLYCMYSKFAQKKGWKVEMVENRVDYKGRTLLVSLLIKGENVFNWLKNESGVHRVQRVPKTERAGRVHTSTATVVILPEPQDIVLKISNSDLRYEPHRSSGAGGQHVNTTDSAVRVVHIPTGIIAVSQDGRSQHDNKEKALKVLKSRLWEKIQSEKEKKVGNLRSSMIGTAERSEKIRTYNFPDNRVTDHRLKIIWKNLNFILEGDLEEICQNLINHEVEKKISEEK